MTTSAKKTITKKTTIPKLPAKVVKKPVEEKLKASDVAQEEDVKTPLTRKGSVEDLILGVAEDKTIVPEKRTLETIKAEMKVQTGVEPTDDIAQAILDAETGDEDGVFEGEDKVAPISIVKAPPKPNVNREEPTGAEDFNEPNPMQDEIDATEESFDDLPYGDGGQGSGIFIQPQDLLTLSKNAYEQIIVQKDMELIQEKVNMNQIQEGSVKQQLEILKRDKIILDYMSKDLATKKGTMVENAKAYYQGVKSKYSITREKWSFDPETGEVKF